METGLALVDSTDWSRLHHAYGRATDTPGHLRALARDDAGARNDALEHLWSAVMHQGTPWTSTGVVALVVAGLLTDPGARLEAPVRASLTAFLRAVAGVFAASGTTMEELQRWAAVDIGPLAETDDESLYEDEESSNALYARAVLGCVAARPRIAEAIAGGLRSSDTRTRMEAAAGAVAVVNSPPRDQEGQMRLEHQLAGMAANAQDPDERSTLVLALGDLGAAPTSFLLDRSPGVRMCAALAPALKADERSTTELLRALEHHAGDLDGWFSERPPQFPTHPRFTVLQRLLERIQDFDRLLPAALAVVRVTTKHCVDLEWGPLLAAAFADGAGSVRTGAQRRLLAALVDKTELWNRHFGNPLKWFRKAGLPYDRAACRSLVA